jgi:hypothetical protein
VDDQLGVTWGNHPILHSDDRSNLLLQSDVPWSWDRWSAFWFWEEQPHRPDPWGPGNFNFAGTFVHPDNPEDRTDFDLTRSATENQGHVDTLVVLDGIVRPYDCIAQDSNCYGAGERIQGLVSSDPLLPDGSVNPDNHWADYVYHTVNYFKQFGVHHYQAYNEPNLGGENPGPDPGVWNNGPDPDEDEWADDYAQLVTVTLAAAQAADSQANIVLAASVSNLNQYQGSNTWLDRAYREIVQQGLYDDVGALALHSYQIPVWTREMYGEIQTKYPKLAALPVWITESGVALCEHAIPGHPCVSDQEEQAAYVVQQYAYALTIEAERVFHHRLVDDGEAAFGLYDPNLAPRAIRQSADVIADYLQGGKFDDTEEGDNVFPSDGKGYAKLVFDQPDQKVTVLWATTDQDVDVEIPISETRRTYWVDQAGDWDDITGQSFFRQTLPGATATNELYEGRPMVGGYTYLLIETDEPVATPPEGEAAVICRNGRAVGTDLQGYDADSGLASLSYACSPEKTYDLSWTEPGRTYAGPVYIAPPEDTACTLTLTDERASESASERIGESAISRSAVLLYRHVILVYADGEPGYSLFIVHLVIVNCPPAIRSLPDSLL